MQRTTKYVALDVYQATTVAVVRAASGRVIARTILSTEEPAIVEFLRGMRGAVHVAFEEGTQAQWLHDVLVPLVDRVVVCDRRGAPPAPAPAATAAGHTNATVSYLAAPVSCKRAS